MDNKKRIQTLKKYRSLDKQISNTFDRVTKLVATTLDVPIVLISLVDEVTTTFKSTFGIEIEEIVNESGLCATVILGDELYTIEDATIDARTIKNSLVTGEFGLKFYAGFPLKVKDGSNIGTLCVMDKKNRTLNEKEKEILKECATMVVEEFEVQMSVYEYNHSQVKMANMLKAIYESSQDASTFIDTDLIIKYTNQKAKNIVKQIFGKEEQIGDNCLDYVLPEYREEFLGYFQRILKGEKIDIEKSEGKNFWRFIMFPVHNDKNEIVGIAHNVQDITASKITSQKLLEQNQALKEIAWQQSHEVRRPLTNIISMCDLIKDDLTASREELSEYISLINESSKSLDQIIHKIVSKATNTTETSEKKN